MCAECHSRLVSCWFDSTEFLQKEQSTAAFRASIKALVPQFNTSLADWWRRVSDAFIVWQKYGVETSCHP